MAKLQDHLVAWFTVATLACCIAGRAAATEAPVYGLFVGIDRYQGASGSPGSANAFSDLSGAKADVALLRDTLSGAKFRLPFDDAQHVIVLEDEQATRAAIGQALATLITRASKEKNATILFFFSGHGAQVSDTVGDQADGLEGTIVPFDGRAKGQPMRDIQGRELRRVFDAANTLGVNVVSVFDSCTSAPATRGFRPGHIRTAPFYVGQGGGSGRPDALPLPHAESAAAAAKRTGTQVHMAAALAGEAASEHEVEGVWRGDYTAALVSVLKSAQIRPGAAYFDIQRAIALRLQTLGSDAHPFLGGAGQDGFLQQTQLNAPLYAAARAQDGSYRVDGGQLSGVTEGSTFAVFASATDALQSAAPKTKGRIAQAHAFDARLELDPAKGPAGTLPKNVWLLETRHDFGAHRLRLALAGASKPDADRVAALTRTIDFIQISDPKEAQLVLQYGPPGARLLTVDGVPLTARFAPGDLEQELKQVARYYALLTLGQDGTQSDVVLEAKRDCTAPNGAACVEAPQNVDGGYVFRPGDHLMLSVRNNSKSNDYFVAVVHLASNFKVTPLYPPSSDAQPLPRHGVSVSLYDQGYTATFNSFSYESPAECAARSVADQDYLLLISSRSPVDVSSLSQNGLTRGVGAGSPLERVLESFSAGTRALGQPEVRDWQASVIPLRVQPTHTDCPKR